MRYFDCWTAAILYLFSLRVGHFNCRYDQLEIISVLFINPIINHCVLKKHSCVNETGGLSNDYTDYTRFTLTKIDLFN